MSAGREVRRMRLKRITSTTKNELVEVALQFCFEVCIIAERFMSASDPKFWIRVSALHILCLRLVRTADTLMPLSLRCVAPAHRHPLFSVQTLRKCHKQASASNLEDRQIGFPEFITVLALTIICIKLHECYLSM